jgi:hypothetical protein
MLIPLLFLITTDSLPPLPDLAQVVFPEPPLWIRRQEDYITLNGFAGDFTGGSIDLNIRNFQFDAQYAHTVEWDSTESGSALLSYALPLPHLLLHPRLSAHYTGRDQEYARFTPQMSLSSTLPWAILLCDARGDFWLIDDVSTREGLFNAEMIFDKSQYLPHFDFTLLATGNRYRPAFAARIHVHHFHLALGSPVDEDFFSPELTLQYREPKVKIETTFRSGVVYQALSAYYDPTTPIRYTVPVPDESLAVSAHVGAMLDLGNHILSLSSVYENWNTHLVPADDFTLRHMSDIQKVCLRAMLKNAVSTQHITLQNVLHACYTWTDSIVPLLATYTVNDTFDCTLKSLQISNQLHYLGERRGVNGQERSAVLLLNARLGIQFAFATFSFSVHNLTDEKKEMYESYYLDGRQYAGGIELHFGF